MGKGGTITASAWRATRWPLEKWSRASWKSHNERFVLATARAMWKSFSMTHSDFLGDSYFARYRVKSSKTSLKGSSLGESDNFREKSFHVLPRHQKRPNKNSFSMPRARNEEEDDSSRISWSDRSPSRFSTHSWPSFGICCLVRRETSNLLRCCFGPVHLFRPERRREECFR